jgi:lysyl endopeptidase
MSMSNRRFVAALGMFLFVTAAVSADGLKNALSSLQELRNFRGKAGEIRHLLDPVTVTVGTPGVVETGEESSYVAIHLKSIVLRGGARLSLRDGNGVEIWQRATDISTEDLWLPPVDGEKAILRCENVATASCDCHAVIDLFARGHALKQLETENKPPVGLRQVCGDCDLEDTSCPNLPAALQQRKKAVARILLAGTDTCSGFLVGDQGHLITNVHCIANEMEARNAIFEFGAEETDCSGDCTRVLKAPAERFERGAQWIGSDPTIDIAIVKLPAHLAQAVGHLVLRKSEAVDSENIGILQHPRGESRKYSIDNVRSTAGAPCGIGLPTTIAYLADTRGGSSGSPVISLQPAGDHAVIAIHECLGCPNRGIPSALVFQRLGHLLPASAFSP